MIRISMGHLKPSVVTIKPLFGNSLLAVRLCLLVAAFGVLIPSVSLAGTVKVKDGTHTVLCKSPGKNQTLKPVIVKSGHLTWLSSYVNSLKVKAAKSRGSTRTKYTKQYKSYLKKYNHEKKVCAKVKVTTNGTPTPVPTPNTQSCVPQAYSTRFALMENSSQSIVLSASDPCHLPLTYRIVQPPTKGRLSGSGAQQTYQLAYNVGADYFTFVVSNGYRESAPAQVSINIVARALEFAGDPSDLRPYRENLSPKEVRFLLDKVALGGSAELQQIGEQRGLSALADALLNPDPRAEEVETEAQAVAIRYQERYCQTFNVAPSGQPAQNQQFCSGEYPFWNATSAAIYWLHNLRYGSPLRERMALLWHDHFAINLGLGSFTLDRRHYIEDHLRLLRDYALNKDLPNGQQAGFYDFLLQMHFDGAMNVWLDNFQNTYSENNQNYGREFTELFSLGLKDPITWQPNYTEADAQAVVRAMTGFMEGTVRAQEAPLTLRPTSGSYPARQVSSWMKSFAVFAPGRWMPDPSAPQSIALFPGTPWGVNQPLRYDSVTAQILGQHPGSARYLTAKIFSELAFPDPSEQVVSGLAQSWVASSFDIRGLVRRVITSAAFFSSAAQQACVHSPVEALISFARKLDLPLVSPDYFTDEYSLVRSLAANSGMSLLQSPSVFGWKGCGVNRDGVIGRGEVWLGTQTALARRNSYVQLLNDIDAHKSKLNFSWSNLLPPDSSRQDPLLVVQYLANKLDLNLSWGEQNALASYLTQVITATGGQPVNVVWDSQNSALVNTKIPGLLEIMANHYSFQLQ